MVLWALAVPSSSDDLLLLLPYLICVVPGKPPSSDWPTKSCASARPSLSSHSFTYSFLTTRFTLVTSLLWTLAVSGISHRIDSAACITSMLHGSPFPIETEHIWWVNATMPHILFSVSLHLHRAKHIVDDSVTYWLVNAQREFRGNRMLHIRPTDTAW